MQRRSAGPSSPTPTCRSGWTRRALNEPDNAMFYGGGSEGYTDYPAFAE